MRRWLGIFSHLKVHFRRYPAFRKSKKIARSADSWIFEVFNTILGRYSALSVIFVRLFVMFVILSAISDSLEITLVRGQPSRVVQQAGGLPQDAFA